MLGPALIGDQVVQVREPRQKRLLIAAWMVKRFHHEQLPVDGIMGLIEQGAGHGCVFWWKVGSCPLCVIIKSNELLPVSRTTVMGLMWDVTRAAAAARFPLDRTSDVSTFLAG